MDAIYVKANILMIWTKILWCGKSRKKKQFIKSKIQISTLYMIVIVVLPIQKLRPICVCINSNRSAIFLCIDAPLPKPTRFCASP